jgi:HigB_toxin, RelE-like toxic component of a toxin-antitoxin system
MRSRNDRMVLRWNRLVVALDFEKGIVWIKWIGTHRDYDPIDATKVKPPTSQRCGPALPLRS